MTNARPSRKYVLTKLDVGDYVLPSNDGTTLWRIARGDEPTGDENQFFARVWQLWRWRHAIEAVKWEDGADWDNWELTASWLDTRAQAIDYALSIK